MKKVTLLFALIGIMAMGATSFAQACPPHKGDGQKLSPVERAEKKTARMTEELGLTEEQAKKVNQINLYHFQEMAELQAAMKENRDKYDTDLNAVLTAEQRAILEQKKAERKAKHKEHKPQSPPERN